MIRLYRERMKEIDEKLIEVKLGTAPEYRIPLLKLNEQKKQRLQVAAVLRKFKLTSLKHKHESKIQSIKQNYEVYKI